MHTYISLPLSTITQQCVSAARWQTKTILKRRAQDVKWNTRTCFVQAHSAMVSIFKPPDKSSIWTRVVEYEPRCGEEHRQLSYMWRNLDSSIERQDLFSERGTEFSRLTYFDVVRQSIIDPMHNLLLGKRLSWRIVFDLIKHYSGVVKTQWLTIWIQGTKALRAATERRPREIDDVHTFTYS